MMAGKVVGMGFEIKSKLDSYFLMTVSEKPKRAVKKLNYSHPMEFFTPFIWTVFHSP